MERKAMLSEFVNFQEPWSIALFATITFFVTFLRYVLVSLIFQTIFTVLLKERFAGRRISNDLRIPKQSEREIGWSALTSAAFTVSIVGMVWLFENGYTALYVDPNEFGLWYVPVSILIAMLIHEVYYYFLHRWMHRPKVFRLFHRVHHDSVVTSPWTAFSFHPIEAILQAAIIPLLILIIPMHYGAFLSMILLMTISATINHLHIEIYPKGASEHWFGKWWIGASHHSLHHSQYRSNFGLYFTFLDRWLGTESPDYMPLFKRKTGG